MLHRPGRAGGLGARAQAVGIRLHTLDNFAVVSPARNGFLLGLGRIPSERIDRGLRRLATVLA